MGFSTSPEARKDAAPDSSSPNWFEGHILNPFVNGIAITPYNAVANAVNFVSPGDPLGKAQTLTVSKSEFMTPGWFVQNISGGLGSIAPYIIAGKVAGGVMRGTASKLALNGPVARAMESELGAATIGAASLDFARDTHEGETRIGNAIGGGVAMFAFTKGNVLTGAAEGLLQRGVTRFGIGTVGGMAGYAGSRFASGESINGEDLVRAGITGGTMNVALPPTQHFITKGFEVAGNKVSETWNSKPVKEIWNSDRVNFPYWRVRGAVRDGITSTREATYSFLNQHDLPHRPLKSLVERTFPRLLPAVEKPVLTAENNPATAFEKALPEYFERVKKGEADWETNPTGNRYDILRQMEDVRGQFAAKLMEVWHGKDGKPGFKHYSDQELATETISAERVARMRKALQQPADHRNKNDKLTEALVELAPNKELIEDLRPDSYVMDQLERGRQNFYGYDYEAMMKHMSMPRMHAYRDTQNYVTPHDWMPYDATPQLANLFHGTMSNSLSSVLNTGRILSSREVRLRGLDHNAGESAGQEFANRNISITRDFNEAFAYHRHSPQFLTEFPIVYGISKSVAPRVHRAGAHEPGELLVPGLGLGHNWLTRLGLRTPDVTNMYVPDAEVQNVMQQLWANRISGVKVVGFNQMPKPNWYPEPTVEQMIEMGYH